MNRSIERQDQSAHGLVVRSVPKYPDYADDPRGDELIVVNGKRIGGTYVCATEATDTWASYGPAGYSFRHPTREAAIAVQVDMYATDPDLYDRINAEEAAEDEAERNRRAAEVAAERERWAAGRRRARLGDDEPGPTILTVPAYHALYADNDETHQVREWLAAHGIEGASAIHEIRVEQRAARRVIAYEAPVLSMRPTRETPTQTHVVTLTTEPPTINTPARPDLHNLLDEHWPTLFPLIDHGRSLACAPCTRAQRAASPAVAPGDLLAQWPCEPVTEAISNPRAVQLLTSQR
jgi:hypothetical protein